jgi:hypothetical protein
VQRIAIQHASFHYYLSTIHALRIVDALKSLTEKANNMEKMKRPQIIKFCPRKAKEVPLFMFIIPNTPLL